MKDQVSLVGVTTNGTRKANDAEPPNPSHEGPETLSAQSVDERLEALMETIRTWDWRAAPVEAGPPPADETTLTAPGLATTASAQVREDLEPLTTGPPPVQSTADTRSVVLEPMPRPVTEPSEPADPSADTQTVVLEPMPRPVTEPSEPADPSPDTQTVVLEPMPLPVTVYPSVPKGPDDASDDTSSPSAPRARRRTETRRGLIARLWSHRWTKVTVLCLGAAVAVTLIIWGIRLTHNDPGSAGPTLPPQTTTPTRSATSQPAGTAFVAPIDSAQLTQYEQYAAALQTANVVASKGFGGAGRTPTPTQLAAVATAYGSALNLYDFQLHFISWPARMQTAIEVDHAQLKALMSFLRSFSSVGPTGASAWLSDLHNRAGRTQAADNRIRHQLGLTSSSSFP